MTTMESWMSPLAVRVHGEYREMPGLRLTVRQAARLFSVTPAVADAVLHELRRASILARSDEGVFALTSDYLQPQDTSSLRCSTKAEPTILDAIIQ
jgi:hypothetical protein